MRPFRAERKIAGATEDASVGAGIKLLLHGNSPHFMAFNQSNTLANSSRAG